MGNDVYGEEKRSRSISPSREKLGDDTRKPKIIVNLRGIGYKFIPRLRRCHANKNSIYDSFGIRDYPMDAWDGHPPRDYA